jgi:hypothetical protein
MLKLVGLLISGKLLTLEELLEVGRLLRLDEVALEVDNEKDEPVLDEVTKLDKDAMLDTLLELEARWGLEVRLGLAPTKLDEVLEVEELRWEEILCGLETF